jgi:signal transduction histidine kinase
MPTVLVVDDNAVDRERIRRLLGTRYIVLEAATALAGVTAIGERRIDCVLLDHRLPDRDGVNVIHEFVDNAVPVLMMTAQGNEDIAVEAMKRGANDYLSKSAMDHERLDRAIEGALERHRLRREIENREQQLELAVQALQRQRAELEVSNRALAQREAHLRMVQQQLPALLWTTDLELRYSSLMGAALRGLPLAPSELVGRRVGDMIGDADAVEPAIAAHQAALGGEKARYELSWRGSVYECSVEPLRDEDGTLVGTVGVGLDVTQARATEQRIHHVAKMEALGKLSGGVAHDFNNILTAIISFGSFAREALPDTDPVASDIDEVLRAANQAVGLVRQLLAFSRRDPSSPRVVHPGSVIEPMIPMLRRLVGSDMSVELTTDSAPWTTSIDPNRLEQLLVNLVVNARDAMPRGGNVAITTRNIVLLDELVEVRGLRVQPGEYVCLSVADTGMGMPEEVLRRIFDPFYTTKDVGHGTGLGLSTVYGIVQQAHGVIAVDSEVGRGTTFRIYLPRANGETVQAPTGAAVEPPRGDETVLVVEDNPAVRAVTMRMLSRLGYRVLEAEGGEAALTVLEGHEGAIDLLLSDIVMPQMDGPQVAAAIAARRPDIAVVFMSGHTERSIREHRPLPEGARLVEKPLVLVALATAIREALDESAAAKAKRVSGP